MDTAVNLANALARVAEPCQRMAGSLVPMKRSQISSRRWPRVGAATISTEREADAECRADEKGDASIAEGRQDDDDCAAAARGAASAATTAVAAAMAAAVEAAAVTEVVRRQKAEKDRLAEVALITSSAQANEAPPNTAEVSKATDVERDYQLDKTHQRSYRDPKSAHRERCMQALMHLRCIDIEKFGDPTGVRETVLIEFRPMRHLEFLLRNTIVKLPTWNHTVICGNRNFRMMSGICRRIDRAASGTINIIKLDIENLTPSGYSQLLMTKQFWHNLTGEKILLYQEDTVLFHGRIQPFMEYDYIGAPWPPHQDDNSYGVGNGGFSLRSKSKLTKCLEEVPVSSLKLGRWTVDYMNNTNSTFVPEDVFFSKAMIDRGIGRVASREVAMSFSQETQKSCFAYGWSSILASPER